VDAQLKQEQIQVERERIAVDAQKEEKRTSADFIKHQSTQMHDRIKQSKELAARSTQEANKQEPKKGK
jgi:hypothetical protein